LLPGVAVVVTQQVGGIPAAVVAAAADCCKGILELYRQPLTQLLLVQEQ
jgi:hypothetical protein